MRRKTRGERQQQTSKMPKLCQCHRFYVILQDLFRNVTCHLILLGFLDNSIWRYPINPTISSFIIILTSFHSLFNINLKGFLTRLAIFFSITLISPTWNTLFYCFFLPLNFAYNFFCSLRFNLQLVSVKKRFFSQTFYYLPSILFLQNVCNPFRNKKLQSLLK